MTVDLTGGLDPIDDLPLLEQPAEQATFGENHAFWIFDRDGRYYVNTHLNTIESHWPLRRERVHVSLPGGRVLANVAEGTLTAADGPGAATLTARCVEPFRRWVLTYAGSMLDTTQAALADGPVGEGSRVLVRWDADIIAAAPPFRQGGTADTSRAMTDTDAGRFIGGSRYEQLFRAEVRFEIVGEQSFTFSGTGTRTHRRGTRNVTGYAGHDWQSAVFPGGAGFYFMRFPRADGTLAWSEAFLLHEGRILPAVVHSDTWLTSRQLAGEKMPIRLRSDLGETVIEGETLGTVFWPMNPEPPNPLGRPWGIHEGSDAVIALSQGWARYTMNGETATGLCERSTFVHRLESES